MKRYIFCSLLFLVLSHTMFSQEMSYEIYELRTWNYETACVHDNTPPEISSNTFNNYIWGDACSTSFSFNKYQIHDESGIYSLKGYYSGPGLEYDPNGVLKIVNFTDGEFLENLSIGKTEMKIIAQDSCDNILDTIITIVTMDRSYPNVQLKPYRLEMGLDSCQWIYPIDIDNGSNDNCSDIDLKIQIFGDSIWHDSIMLCCGNNTKYIVKMKVTDSSQLSKIDETSVILSCDTIVLGTCQDYELLCSGDLSYYEQQFSTRVIDKTVTLATQSDNGAVGNTWIPFNMTDVKFGSILKGTSYVLIQGNSERLILHPPSSLGMPPVEIDNLDGLLCCPYSRDLFEPYKGMHLPATKNITEISYTHGDTLPEFYGDTWYFQFINSSLIAFQPEIYLFNIDYYLGYPSVITEDFHYIISEKMITLDCNESDEYSSRIEREWIIVDKYGNDETCVQNILLIAPQNSDIELPSDITLGCDGKLNPKSISPQISGAPSFGKKVIDETLCRFIITFEDEVEQDGNNGFIVTRTWTYGNSCSMKFDTYTQTISLIDNVSPSILSNIIRVYSSIDCQGILTSDRLKLKDGCSEIEQIQVFYSEIGMPYDSMNSNMLDFTNGDTLLLSGIETTGIRIIASDVNGNILDTIVSVKVFDYKGPVFNHLGDTLRVTLNPDSCITINQSFYEEFVSDCSLSNPNYIQFTENLTLPWSDSISFCCDKIGKDRILLKITDDFNNTTFVNSVIVIADDNHVCDTHDATDNLGNSNFKLFQNTPNPFQKETSIGFFLPSKESISLNIIDISGKVIKTYSGTYGKGNHTIKVDIPLSAGVYYYQMVSKSYAATNKMLVLE